MGNKNKLQTAIWADMVKGTLVSVKGIQPIQMAKSDATALPLILDESGERPFGASLIRFAPSEKVSLHVHIGSHILLVTYGNGILTYFESKFSLEAGMMYLVPSWVPHAIESSSESELVLIVIGNNFRSEGSADRLKLVGENHG